MSVPEYARWSADPREHRTSLADLLQKLDATVIVCSCPENQLNARKALKVVDQLPYKLKPQFQRKIISIIDLQSSASQAWTYEKIRTTDKHQHFVDIKEQAPQQQQQQQQRQQQIGHGSMEESIQEVAMEGFAIKNSQWNSFWRGKVAGSLTMALSMAEPKELTAEDLKQIGIGVTRVDTKAMHVAIAAVIDGGPVTAEEQRALPEMIDEVVFDLRRRDYPWAANTLVILVHFPDVESFIQSLDGHTNLVRSSHFQTRQIDEFVFCTGRDEKVLRLPMAWEFAAQTSSAQHPTLLSGGVSLEQALTITEATSPLTLYHRAISGDNAGTKQLVEAKASVSEACLPNGLTALATCSMRGLIDIMEVLLQAAPDVKMYADQGNDDCATPLYHAAQEGHDEAVKVLIQYQADVNLARSDGTTPLFMASQEGHTDTVAALICAKANIRQADEYGITPVASAAQHGHVDTVAVLIGAQADIDQADKDGRTPIYTAAYSGHSKVVEKLIEIRVNTNQVNYNGATPVFVAAQNGHMNTVAVLIQRQADVNRARKDGLMPICTAAQKGHADVVAALIGAQADVDQVDEDGQTPTFAAARKGHPKVIEQLIHSRADIYLPENEGYTPLQIAAQNGHFEIVEQLLQNRELSRLSSRRSQLSSRRSQLSSQRSHLGSRRSHLSSRPGQFKQLPPQSPLRTQPEHPEDFEEFEDFETC